MTCRSILALALNPSPFSPCRPQDHRDPRMEKHRYFSLRVVNQVSVRQHPWKPQEFCGKGELGLLATAAWDEYNTLFYISVMEGGWTSQFILRPCLK